jgi:O-antigen ligase
MPRSATQRRSPSKPSRSAAPADITQFAPWLTGAAFFLSLVLVIIRALMTETIRAGNFGAFSAEYAPQAPGPATSLLMDLLFCLPALLVLARRVLDRDYALRLSWSAVPMGLLAVWAAASVIWSDDKFSAAISAANWGAALAFIWSTAQLVRSWLRLRLVAGVCFGLLLVLVVSGWWYRLIDWPDLKRNWQETSAELLSQLHKEPGSREAEQFGKNIASGTPLGFSVSTNTYGALLVLTMAVSAGVALQRRKDRDSWGWIVPIALTVPPAALLLIYTQSKAAGVTAGLGVLAYVALWLLGDRPRRHARLAFFAGVGVFLLGVAALVGHGLAHRSLPTSSLAFRWNYWVASGRLFARHPLIGVGWENFGSHYLAYRLPVAPEEIRDPHDFFVRAFVELGAIGGLLMIAWMLLLWWELAGPVSAAARPNASSGTGSKPKAVEEIPALRPAPLSAVAPTAAEAAPTRFHLSYATPTTAHKTAAIPDSGYPAFAIVIALAVVAVGLNIAIGFDWAAQGAFLFFEAFRRVIYLLFFLGGLIVVVLPSMSSPGLDDRPAPWVLTGIRLALGLFLLHNLIEFSLFEPGAMFLFALLAGSALGIRLVERSGESPAQPSTSRGRPTPRGRKAAGAALAVGGLAWLAAAVALAGPVGLAEASAHDGDEQMRQASASERKVEMSGGMVRDTRDAMARSNFAAAAAAEFESALRNVPYNSDYAFRAAQAWRFAGWPDRARPLLAKAIQLDPSNVNYYLTSADDEMETAGHEATRNEPLIIGDFKQALALDPNTVAARLDYAAALEQFGHKSEAADQYSSALWYNAQLSREESKRLPDRRVQEIEKKRDALLK